MEKRNNTYLSFLDEWNLRYPQDYFWRKRHGIAFGSKQHLEANHVFMLMEVIEEIRMRKAEQKFKDEHITEDEYEQHFGGQPERTVIKMSKEEVDEEFDNLDLSEYDDPK